jgi:hypothetical protein
MGVVQFERLKDFVEGSIGFNRRRKTIINILNASVDLCQLILLQIGETSIHILSLILIAR